MRTKRRVIAAKIEQAEGVPEALTAAEAGLLVIDPRWTPDITMLPRNVIMATFSKLPDLAGARMAQIALKAEVMGRGAAFAAGNLPLLSPYLRGCGLAETLDVTGGSEKVTYKRASSGIPSLTMGLYTDGVVKKIAGARGIGKFTGDVGGALYFEATYTGVYVDPTDGAVLAPSYLNLQPPQLLGANFLVDAFAPVLKSFEIDLGNKLAPREDLNSPSGYKSFDLVDGDTRGRMDPEMTLVATHDFYGRWKAGITGALSIGAFGPAQYNRVKITAPRLVTTKVAEGEREGREIVNVEFQLAMNAGDDEFVLEFS
ncbi:MAG: hypothetical protein IH614_06265 [Desulfuromonadales bacterium]|nr:hypothetical protein [Desulfuromonadales bacterium]